MSQIHALASELLAGEEELAWHTTQLARSATEYLPTPQSVHAEAAVPAKYVPARQFWHVVAFEALANLPAGQAVQSSVYMPREK